MIDIQAFQSRAQIIDTGLAILTPKQLAERMDISIGALRVSMSQHGIKSPRSIEMRKRREFILKWHRKGWSNHDIAEQCMCSVDAVRMVLQRYPAPGTQLLLFGLRRFTIKAPPPRIVHIRRHHVKDPAVQLELDFQGVPVETTVALSVPSPRRVTGSGLSTSIADAA